MVRSRLFEEAVKKLWEDGKIPGEMHLGIGEEAIIAGVVSQLVEGDALALDHRGTAPLDVEGLKTSVAKTGALVVVDEDYNAFGLSGEVATRLLEEGLMFKYGRVCTEDTIPFARALEDQALPNVQRIVETATRVTNA
ncbi:MAG TPA: transketolase C-terminal domain-containing protein [Candidatus Lokiarchaeia archaeon]|nr:transketolase C-terminal domain-containing protein [Candidatus Lokiarchaeia archaeon]